MTNEELLYEIPSARVLLDWFGYIPSFHDAEVVQIVLNRQKTSEVTIHAFATMKGVNSKGQYITESHALVTFCLSDVSDTELNGFNHQNVIFGLKIEKAEAGLRLNLSGCYGVQGYIVAEGIEIRVNPGLPEGSIYVDTLRSSPPL